MMRQQPCIILLLVELFSMHGEESNYSPSEGYLSFWIGAANSENEIWVASGEMSRLILDWYDNTYNTGNWGVRPVLDVPKA